MVVTLSTDVYIPFPAPERRYSVPYEYILDGPRVDGGVRTQFYGSTVLSMVTGGINWGTDDIKMMLCTREYGPRPEHRYLTDVTGEVRGPGYRSGGKPLTGKTVTAGPADSFALEADDVTWPSATITAASAVVYKDTGDALTSPLISYISFGSDVVVVCGSLSITWMDSVGGVDRPVPTFMKALD